MNAYKPFRFPIYLLFAAVLLLLAACKPVVPTAIPTVSPDPTTAPLIQATEPPAEPTLLPTTEPEGTSLDYSAVAQDVTLETVPAQPATADGAFWEAGPEYNRLTLQGYPVADRLFGAQILVYPVDALASANPNMAKVAADLQTLLQSQQTGESLPFLPLLNEVQVMHPQVQYLDFKNGKGIRYLTQYNQAPAPVNNNQLIYTFQGLTSDGKYYVSAVLPVTSPELPSGTQAVEQQADTLNDYQGYVSNTVNMLNQQPPESFTPDLSQLDALIRSLEVH